MALFRKRKKTKKQAWLLRLVHRLGYHPGRVVSEILEWVEVLVVAGVLAALIMSFVTVRMHVPTRSMVPTIEVGDSFFVDRVSYYFRDPVPGDIVVFRHTDSLKIEGVEDESLAARIGLRTGDRIKQINNIPVADGELAMIASIEDGTSLEIIFDRKEDGTWLRYRAILGPKPSAAATLADLGISATALRTRYVKRLVAVGGDTVEIRDGVVYVNQLPLDGERFNRTYSINPGTMRYAVEPTAVPEGHYFVLGDNTNDSLDSRYWGFVEESDFIGEPYIRVWPFSRFGSMVGD